MVESIPNQPILRDHKNSALLMGRIIVLHVLFLSQVSLHVSLVPLTSTFPPILCTAERNELDEEILKLLKGFGATTSELTETEARGELFGGIEEANRKTAHRRKVEKTIQENKAAEAAKKAESAQSAMGDAMNALKERGEKINEMGDKASDLLEGAQEYGDMAKQLKETMKAKKKRWF